MESNVFLVVQTFSQQWKIASTSWHLWYYSCHLVLWLHPKWFVISLFYTAMYMYLHIYITCIIYILYTCRACIWPLCITACEKPPSPSQVLFVLGDLAATGMVVALSYTPLGCRVKVHISILYGIICMHDHLIRIEPWSEYLEKKDIALMKHAICYGYMLYYNVWFVWNAKGYIGSKVDQFGMDTLKWWCLLPSIESKHRFQWYTKVFLFQLIQSWWGEGYER